MAQHLQEYWTYWMLRWLLTLILPPTRNCWMVRRAGLLCLFQTFLPWTWGKPIWIHSLWLTFSQKGPFWLWQLKLEVHRSSIQFLRIMTTLTESCTHLVQQYITSKNKIEILPYLRETAFKSLSSGAQDRFGIEIASSNQHS